MRVELIGHFEPCMTEIYLHIDARMADYIRTHPYCWVAEMSTPSHTTGHRQAIQSKSVRRWGIGKQLHAHNKEVVNYRIINYPQCIFT